MGAGRVAAADIGGTNCRFAVLAADGEDGLSLERVARFRTADMRNMGDLLAACDAAGLPVREADALVLAVAGPVADPLHARATNADLELDLEDASARHGLRRAMIINDFAAQAHACLTRPGRGARRVFPDGDVPPAPEGAPRAVMGAGTGLGMASLVRDSAGRWLALPSEGGHAGFPLLGAAEAEFGEFVLRERGAPYVRAEDVLAGPGLSLLCRFLEGRDLAPAEVAAEFLGRDTELRRWYARFHGRACRDRILSTLCRGGLYVAGGIAAKNPDVLACEAFREGLLALSHCAELVRSTPIFLVSDEDAGLWGAARVAAELAS